MTGYPTTYGALYTDAYDPAYPSSPLGTAMEIYTGAWTDISDYVYQRNAISITRGRPDESSQANPSQCTMTLNNRDNRFTINNPTGAYYGLLNRNTPLRVSIPNALLPAPGNTTYLRMEDDAVSYASCPAAARIQLTGSIDVRVDAHPSGYGSPFAFASVWGASATVNQRSWCFGINTFGQLFFGYSVTGSNSYTFADSDTRLPPGVARQCFRATLDATTGNVAFYTAAPGNIAVGPWTQIGSTSAGSGAVTVFASTTVPLSVGYSPGFIYDFPATITMQGAVFDMELRSGIGGTVVAKPAFNTQTAGIPSWTDTAGNLWSVSGTAALNNRSYRYHGELSATPKAADPSGKDVYSQPTASGVLRRLQQANTPLNSPLYRAWTRLTGSQAPLAYWPCEDLALSTQLASGLPSVAPMQISGTPQLAANSDVLSSSPLPTLNGATFRAPVPQGGTWTQNGVVLVVDFPSSPTSETNGEIVASIFTLGTVARVDLQYETAGTGSFEIVGYNSTGTALFTQGPYASPYGPTNGNYFLMTFGLALSGGTVQWQLSYDLPATPSPIFQGGTVAGATLGAITSIAINPNGTCQQLAVGHIAVQSALGPDMVQPFNAWAGETAGNRIQRLCTEENIQCRIVGSAELTLQMGAQTIDTLSNLLAMCETTDRGMLFEPRTCLGVGYRTPYSMYNQAATATVSYSSQQLDQSFASTCDDLLTINDVTVSNTDGSSARQVLESGALSVQPPPNGVGRVDTEIEVDALSDGYLQHIAQWILHVSTDGHDRFPTIPFNLARPQTGYAVATLDIGDLLAITNAPAWLQPDEIDQLCAGFTETLGPSVLWQIDVNGVPAYPYTIAQVSGAGGSATHADTDGSQLTSTVSATAATLTVATTSPYPIWTTAPGDFPFDIGVAGERMTVTNITGAASPQTFTVTRSVNGVAKTQTAGTALALWYTPIAGQITGS